MTQQLVKAIGVEDTVEVIVGWHNLDEVQLEMAEEQSWVEAEAFACPREEAFFEFDQYLWSTEMDLSPVGLHSLIHGTDFHYQFDLGDRLFGLKFKRGVDHLPFAAVIQEFEKVDFLLPEDPTDEQAMQMVEALSGMNYGVKFSPEGYQATQVIKDLAGYSSMNDADFDALRSEPFESEILPKLFEDCRNSKINDLQDVLSKFFDTHLGRTL